MASTLLCPFKARKLRRLLLELSSGMSENIVCPLVSQKKSMWTLVLYVEVDDDRDGRQLRYLIDLQTTG